MHLVVVAIKDKNGRLPLCRINLRLLPKFNNQSLPNMLSNHIGRVKFLVSQFNQIILCRLIVLYHIMMERVFQFKLEIRCQDIGIVIFMFVQSINIIIGKIFLTKV